jgi:SAM-dependent MidA family methyltransferase
MSDLPRPSPEAAAHSERVVAHIRTEIGRAGGWIPFARYMELALYAPALGYYMAGARKLGADGDFVTAPELAPLFGHTLARQIAQGLELAGGEVLEIGTATGAVGGSRIE